MPGTRCSCQLLQVTGSLQVSELVWQGPADGGEHQKHPDTFSAPWPVSLHAWLAARSATRSRDFSVILGGVYFTVSCYVFAYIQFTVPVI